MAPKRFQVRNPSVRPETNFIPLMNNPLGTFKEIVQALGYVPPVPKGIRPTEGL